MQDKREWQAGMLLEVLKELCDVDIMPNCMEQRDCTNPMDSAACVYTGIS